MSAVEKNLGDALELTNRRIDAMLAGSDLVVREYLDVVGKSRGKLLRPRLVLAFADLGDSHDKSSAVNCAACCELLHTASLVHDDVIDEANTRRGRPTLNHVYGNSVAVIVGDYLLAIVLKALNEENDCKLTNMLLTTSQELGLGVLQELLNQENLGMTVDKYYEIIRLKTAALFGLCCEMGAYIGGLDSDDVTRAREYGQELGMGFQVVDDLLDICADQSATGKPSFNDLNEGRITLPLIHAMGADPGTTRELVSRFRSNGHDESTGQAIREHLRDLGSLVFAREDACRFIDNARRITGQLNGSLAHRDSITELQRIENKVLSSIPVPTATGE